MPSVQIAVNGRNYEVACDAGQEQHGLGSLAGPSVGQGDGLMAIERALLGAGL